MIVNLGSINVDHVYQVPRLPAPGETLTVERYAQFLGGKGANQSIAALRAGADVRHVGCVGPDGDWAIDQLIKAGLDTRCIQTVDAPTGHAIVTVNAAGENQILVWPGANHGFSDAQISAALADLSAANDRVVIQNETSHVAAIVDEAARRRLPIAYSAAPFVAADALPLLPRIDMLIVNAVELAALADAAGCTPENIECKTVLVTRGRNGAELRTREGTFLQAAYDVNSIDTTGAGDTFAGSLLARLDANDSIEDALQYAAAASAIQVTRAGAANAIPLAREVHEFIKDQDLDARTTSRNH